MRDFLLKLIFVCLGISLPIIILELELRVEHLWRKGIPLSANPVDRWDEELGWRGSEYTLGRGDGPIDTLVLGDSFTHGLDVPPERMWFASIARRFPDERLVAYGGLGYGTLQELLVLRRYLKANSPKRVILQLCTNDFINNYLPLERLSTLQRAPAPRPYMEDGVVSIHFPRKNDRIIFPLISYSRYLYRVNERWEQQIASEAKKRTLPSVESIIKREGDAFDLYRKAGEVTKQLLRSFREETRESRIYLLLADDDPPSTESFRRIARELDLPIVIPRLIAREPDLSRLPDGAHYNEVGNKYLGDTFIQEIEARHLW